MSSEYTDVDPAAPAQQWADYEYQKEVYTQQKELYERQEKIRQDAVAEWQTNYDTQQKMDSIFNTSIVSSSAGAFGISFAFINTIVPIAGAAFKYLLIASWGCFALCLCIMITSFLLSSYNHYLACRDIFNSMQDRYEGKRPVAKPRGRYIVATNFISVFLFIGGILCLIGFVLLNV
jgi:hypothetical protein